jgi:hypothetical protein
VGEFGFKVDVDYGNDLLGGVYYLRFGAAGCVILVIVGVVVLLESSPFLILRSRWCDVGLTAS